MENGENISYKTIGELILVYDEESKTYNPSILIREGFWFFPEETRNKMNRSWKTALDSIELIKPEPEDIPSAEIIPFPVNER